MSATDTTTTTNQTDAQPQAGDQHLDLLTDDERAALALELNAEDGEGQTDGDDDDKDEAGSGEAAATAEPTAAATDAPTAAKETAAAQTEAAAPAGALEKPADQQPAAAAPQAAAAPAPAQPAAQAPLESLAVFQYQVPKDYEDRAKALEGKFLDLDQQLADGAIDQQDYNKQLRALTREQSDLAAVASRAEIAREMAQQAQAQLAQREADGWNQAMQTLAGEIKGQDGAPDYTQDNKLALALGKQVETLMIERGLDPSQPAQGKLDLLRQAHGVLMFMKTGKAPGEAAAKPDAQAAAAQAAQAIKDAAAARKPDLSKAAASIANVPAADNGADLGEFAHLDKLEGVKLENALENLMRTNPAAYARYTAEV